MTASFYERENHLYATNNIFWNILFTTFEEETYFHTIMVSSARPSKAALLMLILRCYQPNISYKLSNKRICTKVHKEWHSVHFLPASPITSVHLGCIFIHVCLFFIKWEIGPGQGSEPLWREERDWPDTRSWPQGSSKILQDSGCRRDIKFWLHHSSINKCGRRWGIT